MTGNIIMDELCKGCLSYERVGKPVSTSPNMRYGECIGYTVKDIRCPCIKCLIKGMCDVVCDDFKNREWYIKDLEENGLLMNYLE